MSNDTGACSTLSPDAMLITTPIYVAMISFESNTLKKKEEMNESFM